MKHNHELKLKLSETNANNNIKLKTRNANPTSTINSKFNTLTKITIKYSWGENDKNWIIKIVRIKNTLRNKILIEELQKQVLIFSASIK